MTTLFTSDWLASSPVFYNVKTGAASSCIHEVIDYPNLELDPEGLSLYLSFGYCVLERTPIRDVRFLRHSSQLVRQPDGRLSVTYLPDPALPLLDQPSREEDALDLLAQKIRQWESSTQGPIVVPTSGGFDSRLLNLLLNQPQRVRAFTYGLSDQQQDSNEVVYARALANKLNLQWEQLPLGRFHHLLDDWDQWFGISTHAHGMYQMEFYQQIAQRVPAPAPVLSGIIGDVWAGTWDIPRIHNPADLPQMGRTYGCAADLSACILKADSSLAQAYLSEQSAGLDNPRYRIIEAARHKLILLSYLLTVPRQMGFKPWSPFLDMEVAMAMLNLPDDRRLDRRWQRDFFSRVGVNWEQQGLACTRQNTLDMQGLEQVPVPPLDERILRQVVRPSYVRWINRTVEHWGPMRRAWSHWQHDMNRRIHHRLGKPMNRDVRTRAYLAYLILRPVEQMLRRRDLAQAAHRVGALSIFHPAHAA